MRHLRISFVLAIAVTISLSLQPAYTIAKSRPKETLDNLLGLDDSPSEHLARILRRERAVQVCMRRRGFTYIPLNDSVVVRSPHPEMGQEIQRKRAYGYGLTASLELPPSPPDPNAAIFIALSPSAKSAYDRALVGRQDRANSSGEPRDSDSCLKIAAAETGFSPPSRSRLTIPQERVAGNARLSPRC